MLVVVKSWDNQISTIYSIYIWEVVALFKTQTKYNYGGSSLASGDEVLMLGSEAPR